MKTIPLTKGYEAIVDDEDYERLIAMGKWQALVVKHTVYAVHDTNSRGTFLMHRVIKGVEGKLRVDHRNRNGLDNRRENLRDCNNSQNLANSAKRAIGRTSKYKGVTRELRILKADKWSAWISVNGKTKYLGLHPTEDAAAIAYNIEAKLVFGEFARVNEGMSC